MTDLTKKHCVPCEGGDDPFDKEQVDTYKGLLNLDWDIVDNKRIMRRFKFKDFKEAMKFVNNIAVIAEDEGHHPDIYIYYNKVGIELTTHAIDGLSENDFILAAKIEKLVNEH